MFAKFGTVRDETNNVSAGCADCDIAFTISRFVKTHKSAITYCLLCAFIDVSLHFTVSYNLHLGYHVICGSCNVTLRNVFVRHESRHES
jgi:hypothetical protein